LARRVVDSIHHSLTLCIYSHNHDRLSSQSAAAILASPWMRKYQARASVLQTYNVMSKTTTGMQLSGEALFRKIALQVRVPAMVNNDLTRSHHVT